MRILLAIALLVATGLHAESIKDWAAAQGTTDLNALRVMAQTPYILVGFTQEKTNITARTQWDRQKRQALQFVKDNAAVDPSAYNDTGAIRAKIGTWLATMTAVERDGLFKDIIPVFWIAYDEFRASAAWSEDAVTETIVIPSRAIYQAPWQVNGWDVATVRNKVALREALK